MKRLGFVLLLLIVAIPSWSMDWSSYGFTVKNENRDGSEVELNLKSSQGFDVIIRYKDELSKLDSSRILQAVKDFSSWENMKPARMTFTVSDEKTSVVVAPASFTWKGTDILVLMPAGMYFDLGDVYRYNFRIKVNEYFIRVSGDFLKEEFLVKKILSAKEDPIGFMEKNNPRYMYEIMQRQKDQIVKLRYALIALANNGMCSGFKPIKQSIIERVVETKKANPKWSHKKIYEKMKNEKIDVSSKQVMIIISVYFNDFEK